MYVYEPKDTAPLFVIANNNKKHNKNQSSTNCQMRNTMWLHRIIKEHITMTTQMLLPHYMDQAPKQNVKQNRSTTPTPAIYGS